MSDGSEETFISHLVELRDRLLRIIGATLLVFLALFYWASDIYSLLARPLLAALPSGGSMIATDVVGVFLVPVKVTLLVAFLIALPYVLYQVWAFIAPGLTAAERKAVRPWVPLALVFFALGVGIAYIVLPYALSFLFSFNNEQLVENVAAGPYFDFVTTLFLVFGLVMEFPILLYGLSRVGILSSAQLKSMRRYVILGIAIFAAVATPGGDLVSPFVLGGTMYLLFEATVFVIARTGR